MFGHHAAGQLSYLVQRRQVSPEPVQAPAAGARGDLVKGLLPAGIVAAMDE
jgi:hypothetical protein